MSISSERLKELTETKIGEGQSRYVFGRPWKQLYKVLSEEERDLTEEMFLEGLKKCEFKDPERVGLVSFLCVPFCISILDRVLENKPWFRESYKFLLNVYYFLFVLTLLHSLYEWKMDDSLLFMTVCLVITSWTFRKWARDWNQLELVYRVIDADFMSRRKKDGA